MGLIVTFLASILVLGFFFSSAVFILAGITMGINEESRELIGTGATLGSWIFDLLSLLAAFLG